MTDALKRVVSFYLGWRFPFVTVFVVLIFVGLATDGWWSPIVAIASVVPLLALYALTALRVGEHEATLAASNARLDALEQGAPGTAAAAVEPPAKPVALDAVFVPDNAWHAKGMAVTAAELRRGGAEVAMLDIGDLASSGGASAAIAELWDGTVLDAEAFAGLSAVPKLLVTQWPYAAAVSSVVEHAEAAGSHTVELLPDPPKVNRLDEARSTMAARSASSADELEMMVQRHRHDTGSLADAALPKTALGPKEEEPDLVVDTDALAAYAGRHAGERCVIIGNGPSLNDLDLSLLRDEWTIGVNSIFLADSIDFPLSYYVVEDSLVMKENIDAIKAYQAGYKFFPSIYREMYDDVSVEEGSLGGVSYFNMNGGFYVGQSPNFCIPRFSTDASQRMYCGQSVTIINLQLAYYMGFSEVYVIGMDFSYTIPDDAEIDGNHILSTGDDPNHFHKDYFGKGKTWKDPKLDRVLNNYQLAKVMFEADGRAIYNATAGGKLELFERRDFADVFGPKS